MSSWNGVSNVVELLYHLADEGDVQTVVTMILVLGERIIPLLNENAIEHWLDFQPHFPSNFEYFSSWLTNRLFVEMSVFMIAISIRWDDSRWIEKKMEMNQFDTGIGFKFEIHGICYFFFVDFIDKSEE